MYILAIDQGTTGTTALLLDEDGRIKSRGYKEIKQYYPNPGWVEHDPVELWESVLWVTSHILKESGATPEMIKGIGITNQRETVVLWDRRNSQPVHRAVVWQCRRTEEICIRFKESGFEDRVKRSTGLVLDPYFSGTKAVWLLEQYPEIRKLADSRKLKFGTIDTWLLWNLTNGAVHATDWTNASRTLLFNTMESEWDLEILEVFGLPVSMLPEARPSRSEFGESDPGSFLGIRAPIAGIAGDQQAALFGQACFEPGELKNTYGTGCFLVMNTGKNPVVSPNGLLTTAASSPDGESCWALEGSVFIAGAAIQWLRDGIKLIKRANESEDIALSVDNSGGLYFIPAFVGLGAPYWDPAARGAIFGLTRGTTGAHIVRAALESIAYQTKDVFETMKTDAHMPIDVLKVDGGATTNDFLMQFQADLLGIPVDRPVGIESTGIGAGYLAGLGIGVWSGPDDLRRLRVSERLFEPTRSSDEMQELYTGWKKTVDRIRS